MMVERYNSNGNKVTCESKEQVTQMEKIGYSLKECPALKDYQLSGNTKTTQATQTSMTKNAGRKKTIKPNAKDIILE